MNEKFMSKIKSEYLSFKNLSDNGFISQGRDRKGLLFFTKNGILTNGFLNATEAEKALLKN